MIRKYPAKTIIARAITINNSVIPDLLPDSARVRNAFPKY
jgi:hypothetical protein